MDGPHAFGIPTIHTFTSDLCTERNLTITEPGRVGRGNATIRHPFE